MTEQQKTAQGYKEFCDINKNWGAGWELLRGKDMQKNFQIASNVKNAFYKNYDALSKKPQVGDVVEFSDGFNVYKHGQIEAIDRHGVATLCEAGRSFMGINNETGNVYFSTSGGAFVERHVSLMKIAGTEERGGWTWGCRGAGAHQGIEFRFVVNKWVIPHDRHGWL